MKLQMDVAMMSILFLVRVKMRGEVWAWDDWLMRRGHITMGRRPQAAATFCIYIMTIVSCILWLVQGNIMHDAVFLLQSTLSENLNL